MTSIITRETPSEEEMLSLLSRPDVYASCLLQPEGREARFAPYQLDHLRDKSKFRIREKGRGVGFSFVCAAEALAKAQTRPSYTAILVSPNLEEAVEKIRYANQLYETIPLRFRKKKVVDNKTSIEFEDPTGRCRSRLISHPCKDPRGKHNADVYLDEFAHYGAKQRAVYVAAVPIVSRGEGQLTIGS
ncbi:MAG: terminase large subunit domain-containing protein, partial [Planctomycetota bacterium]